MKQKRSTSILINGRRYDATTGMPVRSNVVTPKTKQQPTAKKASTSIDGVFLGAQATKHTVKKTPITPAAKPARSTSRTRTAAPDVKRRTPKQSATLVRRAVAKPKPTVKTVTKTEKRLVAAPVARKTAARRVHAARQQRAATITMSEQIQRFAKDTRLIAPALQTIAQDAVKSIDNAIQTPITAAQPVKRVYMADVTPGKPSSQADIFEKALQRATSHQQPAPKRVKQRTTAKIQRRMARFAAGTLAFLLLAGVASYAAADTITYRLAVHRAGFNAHMPDYTVKGFDVATINSASGRFDVAYSGVSGDYSVRQQPSNWNSQALIDHIRESGNQTFSTLQAAGRTVYIYGKNQAVWVSNGVLYEIFGNGILNSRDFLNIAASI